MGNPHLHHICWEPSEGAIRQATHLYITFFEGQFKHHLLWEASKYQLDRKLHESRDSLISPRPHTVLCTHWNLKCLKMPYGQNSFTNLVYVCVSNERLCQVTKRICITQGFIVANKILTTKCLYKWRYSTATPHKIYSNKDQFY